MRTLTGLAQPRRKLFDLLLCLPKCFDVLSIKAPHEMGKHVDITEDFVAQPIRNMVVAHEGPITGCDMAFGPKLLPEALQFGAVGFLADELDHASKLLVEDLRHRSANRAFLGCPFDEETVHLMLAYTLFEAQPMTLDQPVKIRRCEAGSNDRTHHPVIEFEELPPPLRSLQVLHHRCHARRWRSLKAHTMVQNLELGTRFHNDRCT